MSILIMGRPAQVADARMPIQGASFMATLVSVHADKRQIGHQ